MPCDREKVHPVRGSAPAMNWVQTAPWGDHAAANTLDAVAADGSHVGARPPGPLAWCVTGQRFYTRFLSRLACFFSLALFCAGFFLSFLVSCDLDISLTSSRPYGNRAGPGTAARLWPLALAKSSPVGLRLQADRARFGPIEADRMNTAPGRRPPFPPFSAETAAQKVRLAEDAWNTRDPERVALAYTPDSVWRNRAEFLAGRDAIRAFLQRKWARELDYRLIKELWATAGNRIAVRFAYEWHDDSGQWFRSYGNENWEFDEMGLMRLRIASINDLPIKENERKYHWAAGRRPDDHPSLGDLGF